MKTAWKELTLEEFLKVKRTIASIEEKAAKLFLESGEQEAELLQSLQSDWTAFLDAALAAPDESMQDIAKLTYRKVKESARDFFAFTVGVDRKPNG